MDNMRLSIVKEVREIPRQEWDGVFPCDIIEGYDYYKTLDESNLPDFSMHYAVVYENDRAASIAPFFTTEFSFDTTLQGNLKQVILYLQKMFPGFLKMKMLFIGSPFTEEGIIGLRGDCNKEHVLRFFLAKMLHFCNTEKIGVITFYNLPANYSYTLDFLKRNNFAQMEAFPLARLTIKERSLEEYIQSLGKSTRKDIRRKLRNAYTNAEIKIEERNNLDGLLDRAYQLYLNNLNSGDVSFEKLTPEYFAKISENMPGTVKYFVTWVNGKMAAFNMCFVKDGFTKDKYIGFDYDVAYKYNLYFVTWCHNIDWCIRRGIRYYQPGTCDYDPKIRLGSDLVPLYISSRLINPVINHLTAPVMKLIEPRRFDPVLNNLSKYKKIAFVYHEKA